MKILHGQMDNLKQSVIQQTQENRYIYIKNLRLTTNVYAQTTNTYQK